MAFFDELGKKISDASQGVVQKTKDTAESIKLSSAISDEEKKIKNLFTTLGEVYFNIHSDNCEEEALKDIVCQINDSKQKIADLEEQIKRLKGVIKCPYCDGEISYGSTFCNFCGKNVENVVSKGKEGAIFCTNCGQSLEQDVAFCTNCGTPVAQETVVAQEPATTEQAPVQEEPAAVFCTSCGAKLEADDKFCTSCGAKVEN